VLLVCDKAEEFVDCKLEEKRGAAEDDGFDSILLYDDDRGEEAGDRHGGTG
jgi:hypothetical protein